MLRIFHSIKLTLFFICLELWATSLRGLAVIRSINQSRSIFQLPIHDIFRKLPVSGCVVSERMVTANPYLRNLLYVDFSRVENAVSWLHCTGYLFGHIIKYFAGKVVPVLD
jgi:hypothetical protein